MRSYKLVTPSGGTSKRFSTLIAAWRFFKSDCPDLIPRDLIGRRKSKPLKFADGYSFYRDDLKWLSTIRNSDKPPPREK